jgi:hypothetical protein
MGTVLTISASANHFKNWTVLSGFQMNIVIWQPSCKMAAKAFENRKKVSGQ